MRFAAVVTAAVAVFTTATEAGFAKVVNNCDFPLYAWSVDPTTVGPRNNLAAGGGTYQETFRGKGISIKISKKKSVNSLYDGSPILQDQYTVDGSTVYYSLANTNGALLPGASVALRPSIASCPRIVWADGSGMSRVDTCAAATNLVLTLC